MSALSRRKVLRRRLRLPVRWEIGKMSPKGFTVDISANGMGIRAERIAPPGSQAIFVMKVDGVEYSIRGTVRWARQVPLNLARSVPSGMGVTFIKTGGELARFLEALNIDTGNRDDTDQ